MDSQGPMQEPKHGYRNQLREQVVREATSGSPAESLPTESLLRGRILLVEDSEDVCRLFTIFLESEGATVECVSNGELAVQRLLAARMPRVDLVLMDMQMPVMDGYDATRRLRSAGCRLPIVALTAHALAGDRAKCLASGCDEYLPKPVERKTLIAKCKSVMCQPHAAAA